MRLIKITTLLIGVLVIGNFAYGSNLKLKWLFAHGPEDPIVLNFIEEYSRKVSSKSRNTLNTEVVHLPEQTFRSSLGWSRRWNESYQKVLNGEVDIVQLSTSELADLDPIFEIFELPFLFKDNSHVEKSLTGKVAEILLDRVQTASGNKLRAFAFTYSGGFEVYAGSKPIKTASSLKDLTFVREPTRGGKDVLTTEVTKAFGAQHYDAKFNEDGNIVAPTLYSSPNLLKQGKVDTIRFPYKDLLTFVRVGYISRPEHITENNFSLFTTIILMNERSYQKLSKEHKEIIGSELMSMAKEERLAFYKNQENAKNGLIGLGSKVSKLSSKEQDKLLALSKPLYEKFRKMPNGAEILSLIETDGKAK